MIKKDFHIVAETGIHARPATVLVQAANKFNSKITVTCKGKEANLKSILAVLGLGAAKGSEVTISCEGEDEVISLESLENTMKKEGLID